MADTYSANLTLTKPEVGGSTDTWGTKWNANTDVIDSIFKDDGAGRSVGINVGEGKVHNVDGTLKLWGSEIADAASFTSFIGNMFFPVGSVYANYSNNTNPADLLGFGTWSAIEERTIAGYKSGSTYFGTAGATGGSTDAIVPTHTHTASTDISLTDPGHTHSYISKETYDDAHGWGAPDGYRFPNASHTTGNSTTGISASASTTVNSTGESGAGKNLPPYTTVYLWRRTA